MINLNEGGNEVMFYEIVFVVILFFLYLTLWRVKKITQKKTYGIDPNVMSESASNLQQYMYRLTVFLYIYAIAIVILHSINFQFVSMFSRFKPLEFLYFDILGFVIGLAGLSFCLYAQIKMGNSWRVGIDEKVKTELVTTGLYSIIRNPTYLGLFLLNFGIWVIWPTWSVFLFNLIFVLFLEVQVRCEEDYLYRIHGEKYIEYKKKTKRYIPFIY